MNIKKPIACDDIPALRKKQIRLLDAVDSICKEHNLRYWIDFGTLLGAVRNGTFIPWDDDIDISMPIADYQRFLDIAQSELPNNIFLQNTKTDPSFRQYHTKIRDSESTFIEQHETGDENYNQGIFLDISTSITYPFLPRLFRKVMMRYTVRTRDWAYFNYRNRYINLVIYWFLKCIWGLIFLLPLPKKYYGQVPEDNGYMYAIPLEYLYPLTSIQLEGKEYPAPGNYHKHLESLYGTGYMTPPPPEKRAAHAKFIDPHTPYNHHRAIKNQNV